MNTAVAPLNLGRGITYLGGDRKRCVVQEKLRGIVFHIKDQMSADVNYKYYMQPYVDELKKFN